MFSARAIKEYIDENFQGTLPLYKDNIWASNLSRPDQWYVMTMENFATKTKEGLGRFCDFYGIELNARWRW